MGDRVCPVNNELLRLGTPSIRARIVFSLDISEEKKQSIKIRLNFPANLLFVQHLFELVTRYCNISNDFLIVKSYLEGTTICWMV